MEVALALLLGLVVGALGGVLGGAYVAITLYAKRVKRELNEGRIDRALAERLADMRGA